MSQSVTSSESWKRMVLRSLPAPAWLHTDGPQRDVVISSRYRMARNLIRHRFVHHAREDERREILQCIQQAATPLELEAHRRFSEAEYDFLIGCRLISPDFRVGEPGCALLLNRARDLSLMVNEEDHLRIQALTPGWSPEEAMQIAKRAEAELHLEWAKDDAGQYLTSSIYNYGSATRASALFHLIGLAHLKQLGRVLKALANSGLVVRGLFGETSRPVGAFFQVSSIDGNMTRFLGAGSYLVQEEQAARTQLTHEDFIGFAIPAAKYAISSRELDLRDALWVLAIVRLGSALKVPKFPAEVREVDHLISTLEVRANQATAAHDRATTLRPILESLLTP